MQCARRLPVTPEISGFSCANISYRFRGLLYSEASVVFSRGREVCGTHSSPISFLEALHSIKILYLFVFSGFSKARVS